MQLVVQSLLLYRLTGSAAMLGVMALAQSLPMLVFSLFGGVIADRVQKKYVLIFGQVASMLAALALAIPIMLDTVTWVHLMVISVVKGLIWALMMPSRQAIIPELVGQDSVTNAVSLNTAGMNINRLVAPAIAGFMVAWWGFASVYYAMALLYLMAAVLVVPLPKVGSMSLKGGGALQSIKEGAIYVRDNTTVLWVLSVTLFMVLLSMPYMTLLPIFTEDVLKVGPDSLGVLVSISGVGALIGSVILAARGDNKRGAVLMISAIILGIALLLFALSSNYLFSLAVMIPIGLGQTGRMTLSNALVMSYTEDQYRGRVMSIYMMEFGLTSFSVFFAGILAQIAGVQWTVGVTAVLMIVMCIGILVAVPRIRKLQ